MFGFNKVKKSPEQIVIDLDDLNYFKFVPAALLSEYKTCLIENLERGWFDFPNRMLLDLRNKRPVLRDQVDCIDQRSMNVNGESLFRGGLESTLSMFVPLFESRNLKLTIADNSEEYSNNHEHLKHQIKINGNEYLIFDGKMQRGDSEVQYLKSLFNILNQELKNQSYLTEQFVAITSIETVYFLLVDSKIKDYIKTLKRSIESKIIRF